MNRKIFSKEEMTDLLKNKHVKRCSKKGVGFTSAFKINAVKQYEEEGKTPREIFEGAGIDLNIYNNDRCRSSIRLWIKVSREKGGKGIVEEQRGKKKGIGKGRTKDITELSDSKKIEYLEAMVAYQKEEIRFLAKLRAQRKTE